MEEAGDPSHQGKKGETGEVGATHPIKCEAEAWSEGVKLKVKAKLEYPVATALPLHTDSGTVA